MPNQAMILNIYISGKNHNPDEVAYQTSGDILFSNHFENGKLIPYIFFTDWNSLGSGKTSTVHIKASKVAKIEMVWVTYLEGIDHIKQETV